MNTRIFFYEFMYLKAYVSLYVLIIILLIFQHVNDHFKNNFDESIAFIISIAIFINFVDDKKTCIPSLCFYFLFFLTKNVSFLFFAIVLFTYLLVKRKRLYILITCLLLLLLYMNYIYQVPLTKEFAILLISTSYLFPALC